MIAVPWLPLLPLDRRLCIPLVHAEDVADAIARAIERRATGPFNIAAEPPITRKEVADTLHAKPIHVSSGVLGAVVDLSWRARLQPIDRGWLDLAFSVPLLDCSLAQRELEWQPGWSSTAALGDLIAGVKQQAHTDSAPLRRRSMLEQLYRDATKGLMTTRHVP
jgi:nucleoside-diphosphate-sugar epimerase